LVSWVRFRTEGRASHALTHALTNPGRLWTKNSQGAMNTGSPVIPGIAQPWYSVCFVLYHVETTWKHVAFQSFQIETLETRWDSSEIDRIEK
jgi:hypothetical protein